jgi:ribose/xylose/arabinose/galactoside ABC-type transport system permease subunit
MRAYFDDPNSSSPAASYTIIYTLGLAVVAVLVAALVQLGWIALGERANISRRHINGLEITAIIAGLVFCYMGVRAGLGMMNRTRTGWMWAQWTSFAAMMTGLLIVFGSFGPQVVSAISNTRLTVPDSALFSTSLSLFGRNTFIYLDGVLLIGLLLLISGWAIYRLTASDFSADDSKVEKAQGAFSTDISDMTPLSLIRYELSQAPGAGAIIGFILIVVLFATATPDFLAPTSIASFMTTISIQGIIAIGVTILMISGEFDLSVGSQMGALSLFFMLFMTQGIPLFGIPPISPLLSIPLTMIFGLFLGWINGIILIRTGIPSFIVTLGTLLAYRALPLVLIPGGRILRYRDYYDALPSAQVSPWWGAAIGIVMIVIVGFIAWRTLPRLYRWAQRRTATRADQDNHFGIELMVIAWVLLVVIALLLVGILGYYASFTNYHVGNANAGEVYTIGQFDMLNGRWGFTLEDTAPWLVNPDPETRAWWQIAPLEYGTANFRNSIVWWIVLTWFFNVVLTDTPFGNSVFAVGGNAGAARAQGINVNRIKIVNFMLVSFLISIAAVLEVARNPGVDPLKGQQWELEVIAMTVIGGALLTGGYGSVIGTLLGALIFAMLRTGLVLIGMNSRLFEGVIGVVIIVAVVLNTTVRRIPSK